MPEDTKLPEIGDKRFAVYLTWKHPEIRDGWMYLYKSLRGDRVTVVACPKRLLTPEEATDWVDAMSVYGEKVTSTIHELVPVQQTAEVTTR